MTLTTLQQDLTAVCLAVTPDALQLGRLGAHNDSQARFLMYRRMVRRRIHDELRKACKRTVLAIGEEAFSRLFDAYMADPGPRTRFFHHLPVEFARVVLPSLQTASALPAHAADLLRLEAARREVANLKGLAAHERDALRDFDFDQPVVLQPALRLLRLEYAVHELESGDEPCRKDPTLLLVFRARDDARVRHFVVNPVTFDILRAISKRSQAMKEAVALVGRQRNLIVDGPFLEGLCAVLADFIDAELILGCQRAEETDR